MRLAGRTIGFAVTGSHCRVEEVIAEVARLMDEGAKVLPIFSPAVDTTSTRFYHADDLKARIREITGEDAIVSIVQAEPIGPQRLLDALVVAPASGNTIAKLAGAITDNAVLMACKAHLRNERPLVIAVSTNDGLAGNGRNIGALMNQKHVYMVPFGQDDPHGKPNSLVAQMSLITETICASLEGRQIQPVIVEVWRHQPGSRFA